MIPYLMTFAGSILFTYLANYMFKKRHDKIACFFSIIAILFPCYLAGARSDSVGIDVMVYAKPEYLKAIQCSSFFQYYPFSSCEILYSLLVFCCSRVGDLSLLLFVTQLLTIVPVYISAYLLRKKSSMPLIMMGYLFIYYNLSLSIMRQSISMALLLLIVTLYIEEGRVSKKLIPLTVAAGLFHYFAFVLILLVFIIEYSIRSKKSKIRKAVIVGVVILGMVNIKNIVTIFASISPVLFGKYLTVLNQINYSGFSFGDTVMKLVLLAFCVAPRHKVLQLDRKKNEKYSFLIVLGMVFQFSAIFSEYLLRISYYLQFFMILPFGTIKYITNKESRYIMYGLLAACLFAYWYVVYISWGWHGTNPFEFR